MGFYCTPIVLHDDPLNLLCGIDQGMLSLVHGPETSEGAKIIQVKVPFSTKKMS